MNDLLLLALLLGEPKYGYQLKREAGWMLGQEALHSNIVYPMLRRFLEQKWVTRKATPGERGQTRQQYALTADGRRHLLERTAEFGPREAGSEQQFHLRVGLFDAMAPATRESILSARESYLQHRDRRLASLQHNMELGKFGTEIVRHLRKKVEMDSLWLRRLRRIQKRRKSEMSAV